MTTFYFLALAFCWGTAFIAAKNISEAMDPLWGAFFRVTAGFVFFCILFAIRRKSVKLPAKELWRPWLLSILLISFPFFLMSWGQQFVPSGLGGVFNGTVPIWAFILGAILLKGEDSFSWARGAGVLLGVAGIFIIMLPKVKFAGGSMELYGSFALLTMAVSYAAGNVATKYIMVDHSVVSTESNIFHQYLSACVLLLVCSLIFADAPAPGAFTTKTVLSILHAGVMSSAVAFLLLLELIKRLGATRASSVTYLTPIVALITDFCFTGRVPAPREFAGVLLIFCSILLIQRPLKKRA